jgi:hypothetical protein
MKIQNGGSSIFSKNMNFLKLGMFKECVKKHAFKVVEHPVVKIFIDFIHAARKIHAIKPWKKME